MWKTDNGFRIKTMKYQNSCYPCCIQVALTNLGALGQTDGVEDSWQTMHQSNGLDLQTAAPDYEQIAAYVANTSFLDGHMEYAYIEDFLSKAEGEKLKAAIQDKFFNQAGPRALIMGADHAQLIYKRPDGRYIYFVPSTEKDGIKVEICDSIIVNRLDARDGSDECRLGFSKPAGELPDHRAATTHALILH